MIFPAIIFTAWLLLKTRRNDYPGEWRGYDLPWIPVVGLIACVLAALIGSY